MEIIGKKGEVKRIQLAKPDSGSSMLYPIIGIDIKEIIGIHIKEES